MYAPAGVKTSAEFPIPDSMKAWVLGDPGELKLTDKPVPVPKRAEVLVRIDAAAICATDLEVIYQGPPGHDPRRPAVQQEFHAGPRIHGHGGGARARASTNSRSASAWRARSTPAAASASAAARACTPPATTTASITATSTRATAPTASPPTAPSANTRSTTSIRWSRLPTTCRTRRARWSSPPAPRCMR